MKKFTEKPRETPKETLGRIQWGITKKIQEKFSNKLTVFFFSGVDVMPKECFLKYF